MDLPWQFLLYLILLKSIARGQSMCVDCAFVKVSLLNTASYSESSYLPVSITWSFCLFFSFFSSVSFNIIVTLIKGNMKCGFNLWVRICTLHRNIMIVWPIKWNFFGAFLNNAADFSSFFLFFFYRRWLILL